LEVITMSERTEEPAVFPNETALLLVCVSKTHKSVGLYDATRYSWKIKPLKAHQAEYILAVSRGVIVGVFKADKWMPATKANFPGISDQHGNWGRQEGRSGFIGHPVNDRIAHLYMGKRVPHEWRLFGPFRFIPQAVQTA
jgi:hypothetical protein